MEEYTPGDIVEIETGNGLAYVQVTHAHPSYPPVVKFLNGPYQQRPDNVASLFSGKDEESIAMVPLAGVLKKLNLPHSKIGEAEIPYSERKFPMFRMPVRGKQGEIIYWWFWDGQGLSYSSELDEAQKKMPLREVMASDRFLQKICEGAR